MLGTLCTSRCVTLTLVTFASRARCCWVVHVLTVMWGRPGVPAATGRQGDTLTILLEIVSVARSSLPPAPVKVRLCVRWCSRAAVADRAECRRRGRYCVITGIICREGYNAACRFVRLTVALE